jgi:3'(2'), 5'-bisphosphate nucleotidase
VDPLDGTSEYTQGLKNSEISKLNMYVKKNPTGLLDHVTVLIGVAVGDKAVGGVIHQPYFEYQNFAKPELSPGRTIWGITGIGTGGFEPKIAEAGKKIITTTRSHSNALVQSALDALQPDQVLRVGGAGHKVKIFN